MDLDPNNPSQQLRAQIADLQAKVGALYTQLGLNNPYLGDPQSGVSQAVLELARSGAIAAAVNQLRSERQIGLADAKRLVESLPRD